MDPSNTWLAERINAAIPDGRWNPADIAGKLVAELEEHEPEQFAAWMRDHATQFVHATIAARLRSDRARIMHQSRAAAFADAAASGDPADLDPYRVPFVVDEVKGDRMSLGDMRGSDCLAAAAPFHRRANENAMQAALLEAIAKKAKRRKVRDVFTRAQLHYMFSTFGASEEADAA